MLEELSLRKEEELAKREQICLEKIRLEVELEKLKLEVELAKLKHKCLFMIIYVMHEYIASTICTYIKYDTDYNILPRIRDGVYSIDNMYIY